MSEHPNIESEKNLGGRPEGCLWEKDATIVDEVKRGLRAGLENSTIADSIGVERDTLQKWLQDPKFFILVKKERAIKLRGLAEEIETCRSNWQALAWRAERMAELRHDFKPPTESKDVKLQAEISPKDVLNSWKESGAHLNG